MDDGPPRPVRSGAEGRPTIAVLGAGGFVGSHLVPALISRVDCEIDAVDLTFDKLDSTDARVRRIQAPIDQEGLLEELTARAELVVSLTALCNPSLYNTRPLEVIDANFTHLVPLVKLCAARRRHLIHFSTCEVYGRTATGRMNEEMTPLCLGPVQAERWTYASAKQLLERVIWAHGVHGPLPFTIIRPFNVIGPRMDYVPGIDGEGVPRVLASFMSALLRGEDLLLADGGERRRSFVDIGEFVEAVVRVIERPALCRGEILNLGNPDNDITIRALAEALAAEYARQAPSAPPARLRTISAEELYGRGYEDTDARVPDIDKARKLLGWQPRKRLDDMLPSIVRDYLDRYGAQVQRQSQKQSVEKQSAGKQSAPRRAAK